MPSAELHELNSDIPELRIRPANDRAVSPSGNHVVYWMTSFRRPKWNFALQRAIDWAAHLQKPLIVLEAVRCDYQWASDRFHAFIIQGMKDNATSFQESPIRYFPYVEPKPGAGRGLVRRLITDACLIVSDEFPCFFLPRMHRAVALRSPVRMELVDSNGLLPLRATERVFTVAHSFRRFLQKELPDHLPDCPQEDPLAEDKAKGLPAARMPTGLAEMWPAAKPNEWLADGTPHGISAALSKLPIDHDVSVCDLTGGWVAAEERLDQFLTERLRGYGELRNHPDEDAASGSSPYLHFGHLSAHQVFRRLMKQENWSPTQLAAKPNGKRNGWWNASEPCEAFLDELITWREIGYNMCHLRDDFDQFESLPDWVQKTLADHAGDDRPQIYSLEQFERAQTHDELWNAAQHQLVDEGRIHNYLRMLWGKKILHWSESPREALRIMIHLNNKYALDGRNPNSYSGIFWVLGRYDRAWGPEREIFGKVRYMTSDSTRRKVHLSKYLKRFSGA